MPLVTKLRCLSFFDLTQAKDPAFNLRYAVTMAQEGLIKPSTKVWPGEGDLLFICCRGEWDDGQH